MAALNGESVDDLPLPNSFSEIEKLIQKLYLPSTPQEISRIQTILQELQRSHEGWQFADALLQSLDDKVRFFGALTFTIKINHDWQTLSEEDAALLLDRLLLWLVRLANAGEGPLVVRKLCISLVAYFLRPSVSWEHSVRHLISCFIVGDVVPRQVLSQQPSTAELVRKLSQLHFTIVLWFASGLVEEVGKTNAASIQTYKYHERVISNVDDAVILLHHAIGTQRTGNTKLAREGIKCLQSWVMYAHRAWIEKALELEPLRLLTQQTLQAFNVEGMLDVTVEFFADVLTNFPAFFTASDFASLATILASPSAQSYISVLRDGDFDPEAMAFARMLLAYGDATVQDLAKNVEDPSSRQIMRELLELLTCEGSAGVEDEVCSQALEFWQTYTELVIDSLFTAGEEMAPWMDNARRNIVEVIEACWIKIRLPPKEVVNTTWDSEARVNFKAFRADVEDLLQSSYTLLGANIFERFAHLAMESLRNGAWLHLEATLFCVNALSDSVTGEQAIDKALSQLFGSSLFADMAHQTSIPSKTRRTAVDMISHYTSFFERHTEYLPPMLNFLFESLKTPALDDIAAKAILSTCSSCRNALTSEVGAFLRQYEILLTWDGIESGTKEKVVGSIAAIIQAMSSDDEKLDPLSTLLCSVETDVHACVNALETGQGDEAQKSGLCALRCLVSMGKALQVPEDVPINLDAEDLPLTTWSTGKGASLQARIVELLETVTSMIRWDDDIIEAGCQVLRTGYKESVPGPFVFSPTVTERFVTAGGLGTARLDYILATASAMFSKSTTSSEKDMNDAVLAFLIHILGLIRAMNGNPTTEPEVASSCIDLVAKMIPRYLQAFLQPQCQGSIPDLLTFAVRCLTVAEIMPKRSAADFWCCFMEIRGMPDEVQSTIENVMLEYGPQVGQALIFSMGGEAARSELDVLAEPLKKMIFAQPKAKKWLSDALYSDAFPSQNVGPVEKRMWLQRILNLRGARGTNQAAKDFWMMCRGTSFSYVS